MHALMMGFLGKKGVCGNKRICKLAEYQKMIFPKDFARL
jgi:hypothetical protein